MSDSISRIRWMCQRNTPCGDVTSQGRVDPHFFFIVEVSNVDAENRMECDRTFQFELHVHGLPQLPLRALFYLSNTMLLVMVMLAAYVVFECCGRRRQVHSTPEPDRFDEDEEEECEDCWTRVEKVYNILLTLTEMPLFNRTILVVVVVETVVKILQSFPSLFLTKGCSENHVDVHMTAYMGDSVLLPCSCDDLSEQPQELYWDKSGFMEDTAFIDQAHVTKTRKYQLFTAQSPGNLSLLISHLTEEDGGIYSCNILDYDMISVLGTIKVTVEPKPPTTTTIAPLTTLNSGDVPLQSISMTYFPFAVVATFIFHIVFAFFFFKKTQRSISTADRKETVSLHEEGKSTHINRVDQES